MDVFLLTPESAFAKYQEAESAVFSGGLVSTEITDIERTVEISGGSHFLVFNNTAVYGAEPQGTVRFEFQFVLERAIPSEGETPEGENNAKIVSESDMPKIRKVTDNFGHTFVRDPDEDDDGFSVQVEDEVVVSDDTSIRLTVEEILANPEDEISYSYDSSIRDHPDNMRSDDRTRSNTHTWNMRREDYSSDWGFRAYLRNEDDIYYQNESIQTDFVFTVTYSNLTLE